jgi:hypothetical protein
VNYYDILDVDAEADAQQIKSAFRQKAKQLHPDVNKAPGAASHGVGFKTNLWQQLISQAAGQQSLPAWQCTWQVW